MSMYDAMSKAGDRPADTCSICGIKGIGEWGHNAQPVNDGRCCDSCNSNVVIVRRMNDISNRKQQVAYLVETKEVDT